MGKFNPSWNAGELRGIAAAYALGAAEPSEIVSFEMLLDARDGAAVAELVSFEETAARLALAAPVHKPRAGLRDKVTGKRKTPKILPGFREEIPGFHVLRAGTGVWTPTAIEGIQSMLLSFDREADLVTTLLKMAPGASFPRHHHSKEEQCWVLQGDVSHLNGEIAMQAGDFVRAMPGTDHAPITTRNGCVLLLVASAHDEIID
ncbi:MAG TPA: cupin domain-containing protein [Bryobacteraceae bacterium]|nr:cupin domain-containing protein [Bryobacteraceae bacterium]